MTTLVWKIVIVGSHHLGFRLNNLLKILQKKLHLNHGVNFQKILCRQKKAATTDIGHDVISVVKVQLGVIANWRLDQAETKRYPNWKPVVDAFMGRRG
jgi:ribosomal protein L21